MSLEDVTLRDVTDADLDILFEQQLDPGANYMAGFTVKDPADRDAFMAKWARIMADETITVQTIVFGGAVAGSVLCWRDPELAHPEVSYWLGREFWGKGLATRALGELVDVVTARPLHAWVAKSNVGSVRVLEKCGFVVAGSRAEVDEKLGERIEELLFELG